MSVISTLWSTLLSAWIHFGMSVFPRTTHPMIVHFPIVLLYLALGLQVAAYLTRRQRDPFVQIAGFWLLTLALLSLVAAALAGVLAEQYVQFTPATGALLSAHQRDAVLTGVFALIAWGLRLAVRPSWAKSSGLRGQSVFPSGRGQSNWLADLFLTGAVIMVTATGSLGGAMVYDYGVGTPSTLLHSVSRSALGTTSTVSGTVKLGPFLSYTPATHTVYLTLKAGIDDNYTFDGFGNGAMTITVPKAWTVKVLFINESPDMAHSAVFTSLAGIANRASFSPVFPGAETTNPVQGIDPGGRALFTFVAQTPGTYALVCDIPGHAALGMWDRFTVSATTIEPTITT